MTRCYDVRMYNKKIEKKKKKEKNDVEKVCKSLGIIENLVLMKL